MAVTVTATIKERMTLHKRHANQQLTTAPNPNKMHIVTLGLAGTYATGGFALTPDVVGLGKITEVFIHPPLAATVGDLQGKLVWTGGNILASGPSQTVTNTMVQMDNASTAITLWSGCIAVVFGY